jgi:protein gp37
VACQWAKSKTIFVNSMSDLFHENIPDWYIEQVVKVMAMANWHTYQVLTKRTSRMRELLATKLQSASGLNHIWWGTSVEDKKYGIPRIAELQKALAAMRFLSVEPLLEDLGELDLTGLDWVIVGGESGHGARKMDASWVLNIREQCTRANVPFFFKQWGGVQKKRFGRLLEGRIYDDKPTLNKIKAPSRSELKKMREQVMCWGEAHNQSLGAQSRVS